MTTTDARKRLAEKRQAEAQTTLTPHLTPEQEAAIATAAVHPGAAEYDYLELTRVIASLISDAVSAETTALRKEVDDWETSHAELERSRHDEAIFRDCEEGTCEEYWCEVCSGHAPKKGAGR